MTTTTTPAADSLTLTEGANSTVRIHRGTCKRALSAPTGAYAVWTADDATLRAALPASCCKPQASVVDAMLAEVTSSTATEDAQVAAAEVAMLRESVLTVEQQEALCADGAQALVQSSMDAEADGYVPSPDRNLVAEKRARLDAPKRSKGRKSGDPRADRARTAPQDSSNGLVRTCTGACGQHLPLAKFPTTGKVVDGVMSRGTECRTCRDTRRKAGVLLRQPKATA